MNRRQLLGVCGAGTLAGLAGCLSRVADAVARTRAHPAYTMPPVGEWRDRVGRPGGGGGGGGGGSLRVNNHNTTRSNRTELSAGPAGDLDIEWTGTVSRLQSDGSLRTGNPLYGDSGATGTNPMYTSRAEQEQAYGYLAGESVVGETFVLSVPSLDVPGVDDPAAGIEPTDVLPAGGGLLGSGGDGPLGGSLRNASVLRGMSEPTLLSASETTTTESSSGPSPKLYHPLSRSADDVGPFVVSWNPDAFSRSGGDGGVDSVSRPVVARAMATLESGVSLPVLLYARRLRHAGDWIFVAGWVLDSGALYADAATLLADAGPDRVVGIGETAARRPDPPASVVDALDERGRMGSLFFDGPATADLVPFLPSGFGRGDGLAAFAEAAAGSSGYGRDPRGDRSSLDADHWTAALRDEVPEGSRPHATVVNLDVTLVHLSGGTLGDDPEDSWITRPVERPSSGESTRVLLVDDEPEFADLAAELLEREDGNLSIVTATSGPAGLDYLAETTIDCVISDIIMPGMDGIEFLQAVRDDHPRLPFLFFTVRSWEEIATEARPSNPSGHLQKGSTPDQYAVLAERVRRAVAG